MTFRTEADYMEILKLGDNFEEIRKQIKLGDFTGISPDIKKQGICGICTLPFEKKRCDSKYCSPKCQQIASRQKLADGTNEIT